MASPQVASNKPPWDTFKLRKELPQSYKALIERGFVRECYDDYYKMILSLVREGRTKIVVTGTPGIGTSIFYMYFFERYIVNRPNDQRVVVAAFSEKRVLVECKEWKGGELTALDKLPIGKEGDLFLFDGTTGFVPGEATMICFTSPNEELLQEMIKYTHAYRLRYMLGFGFGNPIPLSTPVQKQGCSDLTETGKGLWLALLYMSTKTQTEPGLSQGCGATKPTQPTSQL